MSTILQRYAHSGRGSGFCPRPPPERPPLPWYPPRPPPRPPPSPPAPKSPPLPPPRPRPPPGGRLSSRDARVVSSSTFSNACGAHATHVRQTRVHTDCSTHGQGRPSLSLVFTESESRASHPAPRSTHLFGDSQVLDCVAPHVAHRHAPEAVPVLGACARGACQKWAMWTHPPGGSGPAPPACLGGADHFPQVQVHPCVAAHKVAVVCFPVLQLHQLPDAKTGVSSDTGRSERQALAWEGGMEGWSRRTTALPAAALSRVSGSISAEAAGKCPVIHSSAVSQKQFLAPL